MKYLIVMHWFSDEHPLIGRCTRAAGTGPQSERGRAELETPKLKRLSPPPINTPIMIRTKRRWVQVVDKLTGAAAVSSVPRTPDALPRKGGM